MLSSVPKETFLSRMVSWISPGRLVGKILFQASNVTVPAPVDMTE